MNSSTIIQTIFTIIALIVSFLSLYIAWQSNNKTLFINSVTKARIEWVQLVRNNISEFCGLIYHYSSTPLKKNESQKVLERIDILSFLIKLQLNRGDNFDKKIIEKIERLPNLSAPPQTEELEKEIAKHEELKKEINELIQLTQDLLKLEWEGVKEESMKGILSKDEKKKLYEKHLRTKKNKI